MGMYFQYNLNIANIFRMLRVNGNESDRVGLRGWRPRNTEKIWAGKIVVHYDMIRYLVTPQETVCFQALMCYYICKFL